MRYFTDENGPKGRLHENEFWLFSNTKMNVTNRAEKVDWKNGTICLVSMFPSWVMVLKLSKKVHFFCNFVLTSARNLSLLGQFTYMLLKVLIILLQKVLRFIGVWATIYEILAIKTLKKMQKCHKILRLWTSISLKE